MAACCSEIKSCQVEKGEEESPGKSVKGEQFSDQAGSAFYGKSSPTEVFKRGEHKFHVLFCFSFLSLLQAVDGV